MSITVRNTKKEEFLNVVSVNEGTNEAVVDKSYFETSADQVVIDTPIDGVTGGNVAEALGNLATGVSQAGKVDDVQDVNGASIVTNKIAKLSKAAVGLGNVDNTADAEKIVKEAGKVTNGLTLNWRGSSDNIKQTTYDGSKGTTLAFSAGAFNASFIEDSSSKTFSVGLSETGVTPDTYNSVSVDVNGRVYNGTKEDYALKNYVDTQDDKKLDKAGGTVTGALAVNGGLTVGGNLTVNGTTTTVDSTTLQVKDKLIEVAHGNTTKLTTPAGLVAPKYDGTNSGALVFDGDGIASVGDVVLDASGNVDVTKSNLQPLATRTGLVDGNLVKYDGTNKTLVDTGKKVENLVTTNTAQEITAAKTFKDEYGTVVINGEITYTPAAASIGGVNINNEDGDRVIGVFANGGVGELSLGSSTGKEAALLLKGEPGDAGQVLVSRGTAKTPAWSNSVGKADSATYATRAGSADKVANALTIQYDATGTGTPLATPVTYDGSAAKNIVLDSQFTVESTTGKVNVGIGKVKTADSATTASTANKLANALTFSGSDANKTASTGTFDGSDGKTINFWADDFVYPAGAKTGAVMLRNTGVTAGVYTAVQVDAKGRTTAGQQAFAVIGPNDDIPSNVVIGGFVLRTKA